MRTRWWRWRWCRGGRRAASSTSPSDLTTLLGWGGCDETVCVASTKHQFAGCASLFGWWALPPVRCIYILCNHGPQVKLYEHFLCFFKECTRNPFPLCRL
ncbi:MAG: hypothetical protein J3K34DRAFT_438571 [Monoraphidium minutum]|nr:MAG: hypothetical protein J3K34DRAFT_438571 [Monoraphidium minutum]